MADCLIDSLKSNAPSQILENLGFSATGQELVGAVNLPAVKAILHYVTSEIYPDGVTGVSGNSLTENINNLATLASSAGGENELLATNATVRKALTSGGGLKFGTVVLQYSDYTVWKFLNDNAGPTSDTSWTNIGTFEQVPKFTSSPVISGSLGGAPLTSTNGVFVGSPTASVTARQWKVSTDGGSSWSNGTGTGGTTATYTAASGELVSGNKFKLSVTINSSKYGNVIGDSNQLVSSPVAPILNTPTILSLYNGNAAVGSTLLASYLYSTTPVPHVTPTYSWMMSADNTGTGDPLNPVAGDWVQVSTAASFDVSTPDRKIALVVSATNSAGSDTKVSAEALTGLPPSLGAGGAIFADGTDFTVATPYSVVAVGTTLYVALDTSSGYVAPDTVAYNWFNQTFESVGTNSASYTPVDTDATIGCLVTLTNVFGFNRISAVPYPISIVSPPYGVTPPAVSQSSQWADIITDDGTWLRGGTISYQWYGAYGMLIAGTTNSSTLSYSDWQANGSPNFVYCIVTNTNDYGATDGYSNSFYPF